MQYVLLTKNLSSLFLKALTEPAVAVSCGRLFHVLVILLVKKCWKEVVPTDFLISFRSWPLVFLLSALVSRFLVVLES